MAEGALVEYVPRVLVSIILGYLRGAPVRFVSVQQQEQRANGGGQEQQRGVPLVSDNGSCITTGESTSHLLAWYGFVGTHCLNVSHAIWTFDASRVHYFVVGVAKPDYLKSNAIDDRGLDLTGDSARYRIIDNHGFSMNTKTTVTCAPNVDTGCIHITVDTAYPTVDNTKECHTKVFALENITDLGSHLPYVGMQKWFVGMQKWFPSQSITVSSSDHTEHSQPV